MGKILVAVALTALLFIVIGSCVASGTGPAYQGPGIEIDVDHHKKTPTAKNKKSGGFLGGSTSSRKRR